MTIKGVRFQPALRGQYSTGVDNAQVYALVRNGQLPAIKVGGRGQWRIERVKLEEYIARAYDDTKRWIGEHPFGSTEDDDQGAGGE